MRLPTPSIELQDRFEQLLKAHEQHRSSQLQHLAELDTLFASLQFRAFRGDL
jgi:type I restriction enzyme S subunit